MTVIFVILSFLCLVFKKSRMPPPYSDGRTKSSKYQDAMTDNLVSCLNTISLLFHAHLRHDAFSHVIQL